MPAATKPRADAMFRAFSDRTRLRILNMLLRGELCVCDIVTVLKVPQPKASRHLAYLRKVGLVTARKEGYWSYYSLATADSCLHRKLLECLSCLELPELAKDQKALKACEGCCE